MPRTGSSAFDVFARGQVRGPKTGSHTQCRSLAYWPEWQLSGHEDQFRPSSLSGGCRLGKATFAGTTGKEEDAPKAAVRETVLEPRST
jgi:hypothetical protein